MSQENSAEEPLVEFKWRNRDRKGYPEVADYLNNYRQIQWAYEDAIQDAHDVRTRAEREAYRRAELAGRAFDRYAYAEDSEAQAAWREAQREANANAERVKNESERRYRDALINSPHREVKWIAEHCLFHGEGGEVEGYARDILAILPATVEEIWEEAKDNRGMCDLFDRFYDQAESEGVFTDGKKMPGARELTALRNYLRRNYGGSYISPMMQRINPVLNAVREDYERRLAEAKAEWQGLDEAWRSERSRRGAETRRRNAEFAAMTDEQFDQAVWNEQDPDVSAPAADEIAKNPQVQADPFADSQPIYISASN